jgi:flagellar motor switch protein FliN
MNQKQDPKWLKDVPVNMIIEIGKTKKTAGEILQWRKGTTIKLEDSVVNLLRVYINNRYFAYGDVLRNQDGEMSLRFKKILLDERGIRDVSKDTDLR